MNTKVSKTRKHDVGAIVRKSGVHFRVWAPNATAVDVAVAVNGDYDWVRHAMTADGDGYWTASIHGAQAGQIYRYAITNGANSLWKNDPRAMQTTSSAGDAVIVDPFFPWQDDAYTPTPRQQQVIYELHVGTFNRPDASTTATFYDAIKKLDYLSDLGINTIELMPISTMLLDHGWGYTPDYLYAVESLYGGRRGFLEFVQACHQRNIGVILDVVYNHLGPGDGMDIWQFDGWSENNKGGIYFYNDWRSATPWGDTRLDYGRPEVRQFIEDNVTMWLTDFHLDGIRLDSTIFIRNVKGNNNDPDNDLADGWRMLQEITKITTAINPQAITIAEDVGGNDYLTKPHGQGGAGFSAQWELQLPHIARQVLRTNNPSQINLTELVGLIERSFNGDAFQRVVFVDSHDTASNGGKRLSDTIAPRKTETTFARRQMVLAAALVLTIPGVPMILQGQEFMQSGEFNDWQGLEWELAERHEGIVLSYKHLIALRKNATAVSAGLTGNNIAIIHFDEVNKVIIYHRWSQGGPKDDVIVMLNLGPHTIENYAFNLPRNGVWRVRFNSAWQGYSPDFDTVPAADVTVQNGGGTILLPAATALILSQDE